MSWTSSRLCARTQQQLAKQNDDHFKRTSLLRQGNCEHHIYSEIHLKTKSRFHQRSWTFLGTDQQSHDCIKSHHLSHPRGSSKLCPLLNKCVRLGQRLQCVAVTHNLLNVLEASNIQEDIKVCQKRLHDMPHTVFAHDAQAPDPQSADEHKLGSQCESLEDVRRTTYSRVEHDVDLVTNS